MASSPSLTLIPPRRPLTGAVDVPGSKSLTNRALLVAALAQGACVLSGFLASDDTRYMAEALRRMGVSVTPGDTPHTVRVESSGTLHPPGETLFLGNAGTATRFLTAAAALVLGPVTLDGDAHMQKRPLRPLLDALRLLGVESDSPTGCPPVTVHGTGGTFPTPRITVDARLSSQYVSALLMMAGASRTGLDIALEGGAAIGGRGYIDLTLAVMRHFGAEVTESESGAWRVAPRGYTARDYAVEPDASSCTYVWGLEALTESTLPVPLDPLASLQPDARSRALFRLFPHMPAIVDGAQMQDSVPALAVVAAFNANPVRFVGIANLRVKECDRIRALAEGLNQIKPGLATEEGDDLVVRGDPTLTKAAPGAVIDTHDDHRIAMSFALAGLRAEGVTIQNPACVAKTFPTFWDELTKLGVILKA